MSPAVLSMLPVLVPALGAGVYLVVGWRPATRWLGTACAAGVLVSSIGLAEHVTRTGAETALGDLLRADALSAFMLVVIGAVALLATAAEPGHVDAELRSGRASVRTARIHSVLVQAFIAAMAAVVLASNLGTLWVGVEATTVVTAFLVGNRRTRAAVEAAWKYVVIGSTGIAIAFLGVVLLNYAAGQAGDSGLDWAALARTAGDLDSGVTRIAVVLLVIGFGTKAGLAPLHAWLPDAHGQAPAPVSALMSGVLLSVAFYAILRIKAIADAALGPGFTRTLLVVLALVTLMIAASLLLAQRDYKRMLAYSSMEHMGLLALGAAAGSQAGIAAVLLHMLGHGLVKSVLFLGAGRILQTAGTGSIDGVTGLSMRQPLLGATFGLGVLALVGMPPFSMFSSGVGIAQAGFANGMEWATVAVLLLVLVIAAALLTHTCRMLLGVPREGPVTAATRSGDAVDDRGRSRRVRPSTGPTMPVSTAVPLVAGLVACAVVGLTLGPLGDLIEAATAIVGAP